MCFLEVLPGTTWKLFLVFSGCAFFQVLLGSASWRYVLEVLPRGASCRRFLELPLGCASWRSCLEVLPGGASWRSCLEALLGGADPDRSKSIGIKQEIFVSWN